MRNVVWSVETLCMVFYADYTAVSMAVKLVDFAAGNLWDPLSVFSSPWWIPRNPREGPYVVFRVVVVLLTEGGHQATEYNRCAQRT